MTTNNQTRTGNRLQGLLAAIVAGMMAWMTGCNTTGYQHSDAAALNSQGAAAEVKAEGQELETTLTALNELVQQPAADIKPQFLRFSAALDRLLASAKQAGSSVNRM